MENTRSLARDFLIAPGTSENDVIATLIERCPKGFGAHRRPKAFAVIKRVEACGTPFLICPDDQIKPVIARQGFAKRQERSELPGRIDVWLGKCRLAGIECPQCQMRHHGAVLARREQHHRIKCLCDRLSRDMDRL